VIVLQYLKYRKVLRWLREDPISWSFFFFFFFFFYNGFVVFVIKSLLCLKVQKTHAALAMEIKNLYISKNGPCV